MNPISGALLSIVTFLLACIMALASHEAAHVVVARALSVRVKRIGISWRGPYIVREAGEPIANFLITLAGPLANVLLAAMFWNDAPILAQLNLALGLSNLLPLQGLDGLRAWTVLQQMTVLHQIRISSQPTVPLK